METKIILVVDDDDIKARCLMRLAERRTGFGVVRATTVASALLCLNKDRDKVGEGYTVAGLLCDWQFPFRPGEPPVDGAGARVVEMAQALEIPFLIISGRETPERGYHDWWADLSKMEKICNFLEGVKA